MIQIKILGKYDRNNYTKLEKAREVYINPEHITLIENKKPGGTKIELLNGKVLHIAGEPKKILDAMKPKKV